MEQSQLIAIGRGSGGRGRGFRRIVSTEDDLAKSVLPKLKGPTNTEDCSKSFSKDTPSAVTVANIEAMELPSSTTRTNNAKVNIGKETPPVEQISEMMENIGISGDRCLCLTNFVKLRKTENISVFQYHVSFVPVLESTKMKKSMIKQLENVIGNINTFDGNILYLPKRVIRDLTVVNCVHPNNSAIDVAATLKFIKEKVGSEELSQFYNVLFQKVLLNHGYLEIRRGFYKISEVRDISSERLQVWPGVTLSVEIKDDGLMVMFDTPNRVLRKETLYDFYQQLQERHEDRNHFKETFTAFVVGKIILCQYSNQCYKIDDVAWDLTPKSYFDYRSTQITYLDYFKRQYNIEIKNVEQPIIVSRIKPRNVCHPNPPTEAVRVIGLVPELCHLTGLTSEQRSNYKLMTEIGSITRLNPRLRMNAMEELIKEITQSSETIQTLANWGLQLEKQAVDTLGRKISSPHLLFSSSGESKLVTADFRREASRSCFHPVPVEKYFVFCAQKDLDCAKHFLTEYTEACKLVGVKLRTNGQIIIVNDKDSNREKRIIPSMFVNALEKSCRDDNKVQFIVAIMPFYREDIYRAVKRFCLTTYPIPSQCVQSKTLRQRFIKKTAISICLQINCKLGGSLWGLKMPMMKKVMIIGMDAAHDPTRKNPSVIALVATMNATCTTHFSSCSYQPIHQEVCTSLGVMFKDALEAYTKHNAGDLPDRIIFYRDGGSAGTFEVLRKYEVDVCLQVLQDDCFKAKKTVNFSYVCVAKRIPQRILLKAEGNNIVNPLPGTVLDHSITTPSRYDFYIVSQQVREGTVNPTHYSVLFETKHTKPDAMQKVAYAMTFMYYNWPGTIKVPSVIQYSHKLGQLVSRIQAMPNRVMSNNLYFL